MNIRLNDTSTQILPQHQTAFLEWMQGNTVEFTCSNWSKLSWVEKDPLGVNDFSVDVEYFSEPTFTFRTK